MLLGEREFAIDANGILSVTATDRATGKKQEIKVTGSSGLSKDEIERMKREAEANSAADKLKRELIDLKNQADSLVYQTKKALSEHGDKISAEGRGKVESSIAALEDAVKSDNKQSIETAMKNLNDASMELGKAVYEASKTAGAAGAAGAAAEGAAPAGEKKKDDVIDAEFEVKE
ncbi:MAG: Hsp70 family protein [Phycisphaerae bacterium]|nr:Hsp70 family protein [Phycisphaerae bacterium]